MKKLISIAMALVMFVAMGTVAVTSISAEETSTVNGVSVKVGDKIIVDQYITVNEKFEDFQGYIQYDYEGLTLENATMMNVENGSVMGNTIYTGFFYYSGTDYINLYDFTAEKLFITLEFKVTNAGNYNVENVMEIIDAPSAKELVNIYKGVNVEGAFNQRMTVTVKPEETTSSSTTDHTTRGTSSSATTATNTTATTASSTKETQVQPTTATPAIKVQSVKLNKKSATVYTGRKITLKATVSPSNAKNKSVSWTSSNVKVAKVSSKGVVTGSKKGKATITAIAKDGSKKSAKCTVTVRQSVTKVKVSKTSVKLAKKGNSVKVKATVSPSTAYNKNIAVKSANKKVAKVSASKIKSGKTVKITAVKRGSTKVTFTAKDGSKKSAVCKVKVVK